MTVAGPTSPNAPPRSPRRPSPACPCTCAASSRSPPTGRPRSPRSGWPRWPASTPPRSARTSPTSAATAPGASATTSSTSSSRSAGSSASPTTGPSSSSALGNLGQALANYGGFTERGFPVAALVDADPAKVGERVGDSPIRHIDDLAGIVAERGIAIGVIATPAAAAQDVADRMVDAGITSILNFAPAVHRRCPRASRCARSTWPSSCRSSASTSNAGPSCRERRLRRRHRSAARAPRRAADRPVRDLLRHARRGRVRPPPPAARRAHDPRLADRNRRPRTPSLARR